MKIKELYQRRNAREMEIVNIPLNSFKTREIRTSDINRDIKEIGLKNLVGVIDNFGNFSDKGIVQKEHLFVLKNTKGSSKENFRDFFLGSYQGCTPIVSIRDSAIDEKRSGDFEALVTTVSVALHYLESSSLILSFDRDIFRINEIDNYLKNLKKKGIRIIYFPSTGMLSKLEKKIFEENWMFSSLSICIFPEILRLLNPREKIFVKLEGVRNIRNYLLKTSYIESEVKFSEEILQDLKTRDLVIVKDTNEVEGELLRNFD